jgi:hypothetical protein
MTPERVRRISQAIGETQRIIDRAMRYSTEFRDHKLIETSEQHLVKLQTMLANPDDDDRRCWLGFGDRAKCPNMCTGRLCGYAKS